MKTEITETGSRIEKYRESKGLNASELANKAGMSVSSWRHAEKNNTKDIGISIFKTLIEVTNGNPYELWYLIFGERYTENPKGSVKEENKMLKEKIIEKDKEIARLWKVLENLTALPKLLSKVEQGEHCSNREPHPDPAPIDSKAPQ